MPALTEYVTAGPGDEPFLAECEAEATALVEQHLAENLRPGVALPPGIKVRAGRGVAADRYNRRSPRNRVADAPSSSGAGVSDVTKETLAVPRKR